jgi:hypothetical protein
LKKKFFVFSLLLVTVSFLIGGCKMQKTDEKKEILKKAEEVTIKHFKEKENVDVTITESKFDSGIGVNTVFVSGHVKGDKNKKISADVQYKNNYKIDVWGLDEKKK